MRNVVLGSWAVLASLVLVTPNASALPTSKITYVRGAGADACPSEHELRRAVAKRVGYDPFFPFAERTVVAQIDRSELARFSGLVRLIDAEGRLLGERKLAAVSDCGELVQNMALAISVAIDDIEQATPPAPAPTTEPEPPVTPQPTPTETPPSTAPPEAVHAQRATEQTRWRLRASAGVMGTWGLAPTLAPGLALGAAAETSWFRIGAEANGLLSTGDTLAPAGRLVTSLLFASLVPCAVLRTTPRPYLCATASFGSFNAKAEDVLRPRDASGPWLALGGRLGLELALSTRFALYGQVDGASTLIRHQIALDGESVYELPWGSWSAGAGLAATIL